MLNPSGKPVGRVNSVNGYIRVMMPDRKDYYTHRLAYLLQGLEIPEGYEVDHIDRNRSNNKWDNLRLVDRSTNHTNKGVKYHRGVRYRKDRKKCWQVRIKWKGITTNHGSFSDFKEACYAADVAFEGRVTLKIIND